MESRKSEVGNQWIKSEVGSGEQQMAGRKLDVAGGKVGSVCEALEGWD